MLFTSNKKRRFMRIVFSLAPSFLSYFQTRILKILCANILNKIRYEYEKTFQYHSGAF